MIYLMKILSVVKYYFIQIIFYNAIFERGIAMFDYDRYGFVKGDKSDLKRMLENKIKLKEVNIDTYIAKPYFFILRSYEENLTVSVEKNRLLIRRNDPYKTTISNVPFESVNDVQIKLMEDCRLRMFFTICNICYNVIAEML